MKRLLVVHNFYRNFGGEDSNIYEEVEFLEQEYQIEFFHVKNPKKISFFDILSLFSRSNYKINKKLVELLNNFNPDAVYIHNTWFRINLGIFKILKKRNLKVFLKIHNFRYDCSRYFLAKNHLKNASTCYACGFENKKWLIFNKYFDNSYLKSLILYFYSIKYFQIIKTFPVKLIAVNNFHKFKLIQYGIKEEKVVVINNPINLNNYIPNEKNKSIIYAGRLSKEKGLDELITAWVKAELNDYDLLIIGDGELKDKLQKKYKQKNIKFLGFLDNDIVIKHISKATAVVTATKLLEGQPRLLCEASALNTLSIYPSFGGMDEFFPEGYKYSFEQFNYDDLKDKLKLIENKTIREESLEKISDYKSKIFDSEKLISNFNKLFMEYQ